MKWKSLCLYYKILLKTSFTLWPFWGKGLWGTTVMSSHMTEHDKNERMAWYNGGPSTWKPLLPLSLLSYSWLLSLYHHHASIFVKVVFKGSSAPSYPSNYISSITRRLFTSPKSETFYFIFYLLVLPWKITYLETRKDISLESIFLSYLSNAGLYSWKWVLNEPLLKSFHCAAGYFC